MASCKVVYASIADLTCTLASLATGNARGVAAVDNTTDLYIDALCQFRVKTGTGTSATSVVNFYAVGSLDNSALFPDGWAGTNAAVTQIVPPNSVLVYTLACPTASTSYITEVFSIAKGLSPIFGGILPPYWGLIVANTSGSTLSSTEGDHLKKFTGVYYSIA